MADFLILLLSMSVSGSILVLLLWGLRPVLGRKLSGAWMYYIWIIVALRMLLPFTPEQGLLNRFRAVWERCGRNRWRPGTSVRRVL